MILHCSLMSLARPCLFSFRPLYFILCDTLYSSASVCLEGLPESVLCTTQALVDRIRMLSFTCPYCYSHQLLVHVPTHTHPHAHISCINTHTHMHTHTHTHTHTILYVNTYTYTHTHTHTHTHRPPTLPPSPLSILLNPFLPSDLMLLFTALETITLS
jgi:hypothetical protein